ncbi:MAG: hypothetical protein JRN20_09460 [Nitrososphaerota archaeon]|nr:hypothetical protein [Nitrososphaerota archaeon]
MSKEEEEEEVERRFRFYRSEQVKKYLKKNGVPKSRRAMKALILTNYPDATPEIMESLGHVHFAVHPQQINVHDKSNEKLIISIEK